jgi:diaminohydroxyphosphoribosylaminopyrimidine deaminase/5-amino-6-(5-phosphoribosylamino)uracil reductase
VGTNTAVVDDPELTVRFAQTAQQPRRFIMGLRQLPANLRALQGSEPALQLCTHDPQQALTLLGDQRIRHVLIEGGPTIARAFIEAGLVDEVIWITAPVVLGSGPLALGESPLSSLHRWRRVATEDLDGDLWSVLRP